ncbi:MAG: SEC-C domain-containing protein [Planctomycetes bacterium]|nr:SEC-C domain-containing protein [Planctomycetota bacterium]
MRYRQYIWRPPKPLYPDAQRNDPCPCGSGKKFKNCCTGKIKADLRAGYLVLGIILLLVAAAVAAIVTR